MNIFSKISSPQASAAPKVLIIGDILLDTYRHGIVSRISPEAPVPILKVENTEHRLGGAANVALNLATYGANVYLLGFIGEDEAGHKIKDELKRFCIEDYLVTLNNTSTIIKERFIADGQQLLRIDHETDNHYSNTNQTGRLIDLI